MPVLAGIDYSMTCPAICIYDTEKGDFCYNNVHLYFRSNLARFEAFKQGKLEGQNHGPWKCEMDRYDDISDWALKVLTRHKVTTVYLEGYSFGSTGKVFNIAENTAILKYNLWSNYIYYEVIPPTQVKKFATEKGNANKEDMYNKFCEENPNIDIQSTLTPKSTNVISPVSDVVDAYYILKYGLFN
jgi:hypothetical protein